MKEEVNNPVGVSENKEEAKNPTASGKKQLGMVLAIIFGIILVTLASVAAYLLGQNQARDNVQKQVQTVPTVSVRPSTVASISPSVSVALPSPTVQPVTVQIDQEPNLPAQDVSEIKNRNINPFVDWSAEQNSGGGLILIKVTKNSDATYPYKFEYVYKNGGNGGFLIKRTAGHLDWYMPDCLGSCDFSSQFRQKYPEIISEY